MLTRISLFLLLLLLAFMLFNYHSVSVQLCKGPSVLRWRVCVSGVLRRPIELPVAFVIYRQEVHQEHVVRHGIHPKYFHLESWKHSPGKERKKHGATVKTGLWMFTTFYFYALLFLCARARVCVCVWTVVLNYFNYLEFVRGAKTNWAAVFFHQVSVFAGQTFSSRPTEHRLLEF